MNPLVRLRRSWLLTLAAALLLVFSLASPASASPETIKRSATNILFGPLDFVLGPVTGTRSVYNNMQDIDDTTGVRVVFAVPGAAWNSAMQMGGGVLRTFTGLLEFIPGLILIPFEADMDPLFTMPERQDALIDEEYDFMAVKIGVNYID
ncbi:MAG: hypothetical protein JRS35_23800 [Deltaproteobacteria bacterium]|nr:hypothetical protein [Deltaproteobacteria bacterium]